MYEDFYTGGDYYDDGYFYNPDEFYYANRNGMSDFINQNFDSAVNEVMRKVKSTFRKGDGQILDDRMMKQIGYFALVFSIKIVLFLAIKDATEKGCEPLL